MPWAPPKFAACEHFSLIFDKTVTDTTRAICAQLVLDWRKTHRQCPVEAESFRSTTNGFEFEWWKSLESTYNIQKWFEKVFKGVCPSSGHWDIVTRCSRADPPQASPFQNEPDTDAVDEELEGLRNPHAAAMLLDPPKDLSLIHI